MREKESKRKTKGERDRDRVREKEREESIMSPILYPFIWWFLLRCSFIITSTHNRTRAITGSCVAELWHKQPGKILNHDSVLLLPSNPLCKQLTSNPNGLCHKYQPGKGYGEMDMSLCPIQSWTCMLLSSLQKHFDGGGLIVYSIDCSKQVTLRVM